MTRPIGTAAELERRRRRAVELVEQGESAATVARTLCVHETSVHCWRRLACRPQGLQAKPHPVPTPGLSEYHLGKLERFLRQGCISNVTVSSLPFRPSLVTERQSLEEAAHWSQPLPQHVQPAGNRVQLR